MDLLCFVTINVGFVKAVVIRSLNPTQKNVK